MFNFPFFPPYWGVPYYGKYYNSNYYNNNFSSVNKSATSNFSSTKNNTNNCDSSYKKCESTKPCNGQEQAVFNILGISLYNDDILILCLLFCLYNEGIKDEMLFFCLILLLLS